MTPWDFSQAPDLREALIDLLADALVAYAERVEATELAASVTPDKKAVDRLRERGAAAQLPGDRPTRGGSNLWQASRVTARAAALLCGYVSTVRAVSEEETMTPRRTKMTIPKPMRMMLAALALALLGAPAADGANITPTIAQAPGTTPHMLLYTWSAMAGADTALSAATGHCVDLTVQVTGTFGTTTVTLQGWMDDTTYATLNDTAGTPAALSFTANGYKHVQELAAYLRPGLSGGTGTGITVRVLCQVAP